jgi:putative alpha-1,2-mannosidase
MAWRGRDPADYVDPLIGTSNSRWMLGPYAGVPFGMVQLGPDNQGPVWMAGYEHSIANVTGFSHIHAWTTGGLMLMPSTLDLTVKDGAVDRPYRGANAGYHSRVVKETERATPGYYCGAPVRPGRPRGDDRHHAVRVPAVHVFPRRRTRGSW